jgi:hypothetical protein
MKGGKHQLQFSASLTEARNSSEVESDAYQLIFVIIGNS